MAHTCDELRHLILFIHRTTSSSSDSNEQQQTLSMDLNNPFSNMVQDLSNINTYQTSSRIAHGAGRGTRRLMTSISNSPIPSFSCRQIDPIVTSKVFFFSFHIIHYHSSWILVMFTLSKTNR
jgi:hypothetical protein